MTTTEATDIEQTDVEQAGIGADDYPTGMLANPTRVRN